MTKEQKLFKGLILADLLLVREHYEDNNKAVRAQAAYHLQQAVEKTIKLKAEINDCVLWGHEIDVLLKKCDKKGIDIGTPQLIREKADDISHWEAESRYYPIKMVRKDLLKRIYDTTVEWLNSGETKR